MRERRHVVSSRRVRQSGRICPPSLRGVSRGRARTEDGLLRFPGRIDAPKKPGPDGEFCIIDSCCWEDQRGSSFRGRGTHIELHLPPLAAGTAVPNVARAHPKGCSRLVAPRASDPGPQRDFPFLLVLGRVSHAHPPKFTAFLRLAIAARVTVLVPILLLVDLLRESIRGRSTSKGESTVRR